MIYLHKILPLAFSPLVLVMVIVGIGLYKNKKIICVLGMLLLYALSTFIVADYLFQNMEGKGMRIAAKDAKSADAIVVLSGTMTYVNSTAGPVPELNDIDRFLAGIDLYQAGQAPRIIFTGGVLPWDKGSQNEGMVLKALAQKMGVPESRISVSREVQNTAQEAEAVRDLLITKAADRPKILLVTSAFHMLRAQRLFENQGISVEPFPVDFKVRVRTLTPMDFLPNSNALQMSDMWIRESIGRVYYQIRAMFKSSGQTL